MNQKERRVDHHNMMIGQDWNNHREKIEREENDTNIEGSRPTDTDWMEEECMMEERDTKGRKGRRVGDRDEMEEE